LELGAIKDPSTAGLLKAINAKMCSGLENAMKENVLLKYP
jgi:hypothetical protein